MGNTSSADLSRNVSALTTCSPNSSSGTNFTVANDATIQTLIPGDLIKIYRTSYFHWGVYIGHGMMAHLVAESKRSKKIQICECKPKSAEDRHYLCETEETGATDSNNVRLTRACDIVHKGRCPRCQKPFSSKTEVLFQNIRDVAQGDEVIKANEYDNRKSIRTLGGEEIKKRAEKMVGPANYDWLKMNCEHFANWCRYDYPASSQSLVYWEKGAQFEQALKADDA